MMREMAHLCRIQPGVRLYRRAVNIKMDRYENQIPQEKSGENAGPVLHPGCANQNDSHRESNKRRAKAGSFRVWIAWMIVMKLMKASAQEIAMQAKSVHQIFQKRPSAHAQNDQIEAMQAS
jgi:hypothetical protein